MLFQRFVCVQKLANNRQQHLALAVCLNAGGGPHHQREAHFLLQGLHHVADAGLRVSQFFRRLGKAPQLHSPHKRLIFANVHGFPSLLLHSVFSWKALSIVSVLMVSLLV